MATFRYRLATLLRLREAARDEKRAQLAEAYRAMQILDDRLQELDQEIAEAKAAARSAASTGRVDVDYVMNAHRYEVILRAQRGGIEAQRKQVAEEVERRRQALVEADRQVRVLEKLREKKLAEHEARELKRDQRLMDELASRAKAAAQEVMP